MFWVDIDPINGVSRVSAKCTIMHNTSCPSPVWPLLTSDKLFPYKARNMLSHLFIKPGKCWLKCLVLCVCVCVCACVCVVFVPGYTQLAIFLMISYHKITIVGLQCQKVIKHHKHLWFWEPVILRSHLICTTPHFNRC